MFKTYENFEIHFGELGPTGYSLIVHGPGGDANGALVWPIAGYQVLADRLQNFDIGETELVELGQLLFRAVFQNDIKDVYVRSQGMLKQGQGLRLRFYLNPEDEIARLPWEMLHDPDQVGPLALLDTAIMRYIPQSRPLPTLKTDLPIKLLLTGTQTSPGGEAAHKLEEMQAVLADLQHYIKITVEPHLTIGKLQQLLRQEFHIWHFIGETEISTDSSSSQLLLEDAAGGATRVGARELGIMLNRSGLRLVVLDACDSTRLMIGLLHKLGAILVGAQIPAVVIAQFTASQRTTHPFAAEFYRALAEGFPIDACVTEGRKAVMSVTGLGSVDWGLPLVYTRAPDGILFELPILAPARASPHSVLQTRFAGLADGLAGLPGSPLSGVEQFLSEYLGTAHKPAPFGGRQAQLDDLDRWLADSAQPYALMIAEAGRGKSALLARWVTAVAMENRAAVAFVPISIRFGTALKSTSFATLGARLRHIYEIQAAPPREAEVWLTEIEQYLREERPAGAQPLLIVLDGADEAIDWLIGRDLRFPTQPAPGVKVLLSARLMANTDSRSWMRRLEWDGQVALLELPRLDRSGVADVLLAMGDPLAELATKIDVVGELHRLSEGDPLLVRLYIEALRGIGTRTAFLQPDDLGSLKPGLESFFDRWWDDQRYHWGSAAPLKEPAVRGLLNLLACAFGPLSPDDLLALMKPEALDAWMLDEALRALARFILGGERQGYVFAHPRLSQYFYEKLPPRERHTWEHRFLDYGQSTLGDLRTGQLSPEQASAYVVRAYGAHLERVAARPERFHELICESWLWAWEALEGSYSSFLGDLERAWRRAEAAVVEHGRTDADRCEVALQCRYALINTSIASLAGNTPPALFVALVGHRLWTPAQGFAYARQLADHTQRGEAIAALAPYLSEQLLREALAVTQALAPEQSRALVLAALAPQLPEELLHEALVITQSISDFKPRMQTLMALIQHLPDTARSVLLDEVFDAAQTIRSQVVRAAMIASLVPHLPEEERSIPLREVFDALHSTKWGDETRAEMLAILAPYLPPPLLNEALVAARSMGWEQSRVAALSALAPHLSPPLLQEALTVVHTIKWGESRAAALAALAPYLSEPLLHKALAAARAIKWVESRAAALAALAPYLSESLLHEALTTAWQLIEAQSQAAALTALAPYLPESERNAVYSEIIQMVRYEQEPDVALEILQVLISHLPETQLHKALDVARLIKGEAVYVRARGMLMPYIPEPEQESLWHEMRSAPDDHQLVKELVRLAPYLSEPFLHKAFEVAQALPDEQHRTTVLVALAPRLPEALLGAALTSAQALLDERHRTTALVALAPHLPEALLGAALTSAQALLDERHRTTALVALAPHLPEALLGAALTTAQTLLDERHRTTALVALAPHLPETLLGAAVSAARGLDRHAEVRAQLLEVLIPRLPIPLLRETLEMERAIRDNQAQVETLDTLIHHVPAARQLQLFHSVWQITREIISDKERAQALGVLVQHLPESLLHEALTWAQAAPAPQTQAVLLAMLVTRAPVDDRGRLLQMALARINTSMDWSIRAVIFDMLLPYAPESMLREALAAVAFLSVQKTRVRVLMTFIPHLPDQLLDQAFEIARAIDNPRDRTAVLTLIVAQSHKDQRPAFLRHAISSALSIPEVSNRAQALATLVPHVPEELLEMMLDAINQANLGQARAQVLLHIPPHLRQSQPEKLAKSIPGIPKKDDQVVAITAILPHLPENERSPLLQYAINTIHKTSAEDQRARALIAILPWLAEPSSEMLRGVYNMGNRDARAKALSALVKSMSQLPHSTLSQLWNTAIRALASRTRTDLLSDMAALAPIIAALGGQQAVEETAQAIIDVGRWFP